MNEQSAPVKEGESYEVEISSIGEKGDGIARVKGFVLFVRNVKKGEVVKVKITKVLKNVGFAEVVQKLERPVHRSKFETVTEEELNAPQEQEASNYEDTEDFGEENE